MTEADDHEPEPHPTDTTPCAEAAEALRDLDLRRVEVPNTVDALSHFFGHLHR